MAANPDPSEAIGIQELMSLETSVLKTLCLTINTAGSELKYKILDSLSDDDFYFPITRAVFQALSEMHRKGDYVISANMEEELEKAEVEMPPGFSLDELFSGSLTSLTEVNGWVMRLKERSRAGIVPSIDPPPSMPIAQESGGPKSTPNAHATMVRSVAEVKKRLAQVPPEERGTSSPAITPPPSSPAVAAPPSSPAVTPPPSSPAVSAASSSPALDTSSAGIDFVVEDAAFDEVPEPPPSFDRVPLAEPVSAPPAQPKPASQPRAPEAAPPTKQAVPRAPQPTKQATPPPSQPEVPKKKPVKAVLSSEGDDWSSYMDDLSASQGKTFETGFRKLDEGLGGMGPGLMLLVDENRDRLHDFLKQTTDQVARGSDLRCLYVAGELPKGALRLKTLARLANVPVTDLQKGRLKKDSAELGRVNEQGRAAAGWLKRVFVYEIEDEIETPMLRELAKKLLEAGSDGTCFVVVDALEKVARRGGSTQIVVSQLRALADALDVLILVATGDPTVLSSKEADFAAVFREGSKAQVELEVLQSGKESSTIVAFSYEPDFCRFTEV